MVGVALLPLGCDSDLSGLACTGPGGGGRACGSHCPHGRWSCSAESRCGVSSAEVTWHTHEPHHFETTGSVASYAEPLRPQ